MATAIELEKTKIKVLEIDLFELSIEILIERGVLIRLLEVEPDQDKVDFLALLQGLLDPERHIAPAVAGNPKTCWSVKARLVASPLTTGKTLILASAEGNWSN